MPFAKLSITLRALSEVFELLQPTAWALPDGRVTLDFPAQVKVGSATINAMSYSERNPGKGGFWEQTGLSSAAAVKLTTT